MANLIFISYSKKDRDFAWKLADDLEEAGHKVWIDRSLIVGDEWEQTIEQKLAESDEVIVILSSNSIASKWVQHEGSIAYALKKKMYPVLIEELPDKNLPIWMSKYQYHQFKGENDKKSFDALNAALTPPNPVQDLMDRKHYDYETYGLLMEPKELDIVAAQLSNPNLELTDKDKRLLLYSGVAQFQTQPWLGLSGDYGILWLQEALQDKNCPFIVRKGAAARLGAVSDSRSYEQLLQAIKEFNTKGAREDTLDLLGIYIHHSPVDFEVPEQYRWKMFLRLARLRVKDGIRVRRIMWLAGTVTAAVCVLISYAWAVLSDPNGLNSGDLIVFPIFFVMGIVTAFVFAETMTSLCLILKRQEIVWQVLALSIFGGINGYLSFQFIAGEVHIGPVGILIGLALVILLNRQLPSSRLAHWGVSSVVGILAGLLAFLLVKPEIVDFGIVISGALFSAVYIFWFIKSWQ
jgi:hypothetical protein